MKIFCRFTNNANADLKRGTSLHFSDYNKGDISKQEANEMNLHYIKKFNCYCEILDGLCGFALESDNLEDAINEVKNNEYICKYGRGISKVAFFEGVDTEYDCPEGTVFEPISILIEMKNNF